MLQRIQLLRQIGQFEAVDAGRQLPLEKLALIYAENARGKTTLAAIFRSLSTGDALPIEERHRLAAANPSHIVLTTANGPPYVFENGAWSSTLPDIAIFDDAFVAENICSGIEVGTQHRQKLHELIIGAEGVALNAALQGLVSRIEEHNQNLRTRGDAVPTAARGSMTVEVFCALQPVDNIDEAVRDGEQRLSAAQSADAIQRRAAFIKVELPRFDVSSLEQLLARTLAELEESAVAGVQAHLAKLGEGGEIWVAEGIDRVAQVSAGLDHSICPLCAQDLRGSSLIWHYRAYFSQAYATLRQDIVNRIQLEELAHGGDAPAAFERNYRTMEQDRAFWANFLIIPELALDTAAIARAWKAAREAVLAALRAKENAPLDSISLSAEAREALDRFEAARQEVETASAAMLAANGQIAIVKEQARSANIGALTSDLTRLKAVRARFDGAIAPLCQAYLDEKNSKTQTETERDQARDALNQYRQRVFPTYESAINGYLQRFGASFRLGNVTSVNNRAGSSCNYSVVINNVPVGISAAAGQPSFRNTLSAGDRNALALAFFFASLDSDPNLVQKVVVIDDPMTSLDDHRSLTTVQELRRLIGRVRQVIVLSHSKPFLCELWTGADRTARTAIRIVRSGSGSDLAHWDVRQDLITLHDKNYEEVTRYITVADPSRERTVAAALRPMLEAFMRVSYPSDFPPGALLGPFINVCDQRLGQANQLLNSTDIPELRDLLDYGNRFHHDSNPTCDTELINDQQLAGFCRRTLAFTRRS